MTPMTRPKRQRLVLAGTLLAILLAAALPAAGEAAGPWRARVVDAETGEPLADVAVIAVWHRRGAGHPAFPIGPTGFMGATETVTDASGRFTVPVRVFFNPGIEPQIEGPDLGLFRAGYGGWRVREESARLARRDAVLEMRPLPTLDERRKYLEQTWTRAEYAALRHRWQHATAPADWTDLPYRRIQRFTREGRFLGQFGGLRFEDFGGLFTPTGVWVPDTGEIVVHAENVYTFTPDGERLGGRPIPVPTAPRCGIAVDRAGHVYVLGQPGHRVLKLDATGRVLATFGRGYGEGDGQLFDPIGLAVDAAGRVWVAESFRARGRVQGFGPDGRHLGTWWAGDDGQRFRGPQAVAVDAASRLHVADRELPGLVTITLGTPP